MYRSQSPPIAVVREAVARSFLAEVATRTANGLLRDAVLMRVRAGELFIIQGEAHRCGIVVEGLVRVFLSLPDGRERTLREVVAGGAVGVAALTGLPNPVNVEGAVDSYVLGLDHDRLVSAAHADSSLAMALAREATRRAHDTYALLAGESGTARQRLARRLLDSVSDSEAMGRLTHAQLAVQLGVSREWVTKTLAAFRREGLIAIETRGGLKLLDPMALHVIANAWHTVDGAGDLSSGTSVN